MAAVLEGKLADRDTWSAVGICPIETAMGVVGSKVAMLIMREAMYGTTRFDDFADRVGVTEASAAARLRELVEAGLLERQPYREPGQRTRSEYAITDSGRALVPALLALGSWGRRFGGSRSRVRAVHHGCGADVRVEPRCTAGHEVPLEELGFRIAPSRVG